MWKAIVGLRAYVYFVFQLHEGSGRGFDVIEALYWRQEPSCVVVKTSVLDGLNNLVIVEAKNDADDLEVLRKTWLIASFFGF